MKGMSVVQLQPCCPAMFHLMGKTVNVGFERSSGLWKNGLDKENGGG